MMSTRFVVFGGVLRERGLLRNSMIGRWDRRSKIVSWWCGGGHFGRYCSRKVITGLGKVWDIGVNVRSV